MVGKTEESGVGGVASVRGNPKKEGASMIRAGKRVDGEDPGWTCGPVP